MTHFIFIIQFTVTLQQNIKIQKIAIYVFEDFSEDNNQISN